MTIPATQAGVAAFLARLTGAPAPIETHISAVFVGPGEVLKLKKAVTLAFLDFSTLEARRRFCEREFEINHAFAPAIYRGVAPVTRGADGALRLGGEGEPVDWVLRMAPIPAGDFLDAVAARGGLTPTLLDATADLVAAMHAAAPPPAAPRDAVAEARQALEGNRAAALAAGLPPGRVASWAEAAEGALDRAAPALVARAAAGRVRRCHGDLHLGNLCLWDGRPTPFDALEFSEAIGTIDTGYDLAFLLMDLELRLDRAAANRVLNRYVARTGDAGLVAGLPFWLPQRAMIRAHCEAARGRPEAAEHYLRAAEAYHHPPPPRLIAIGGLQGTGKSRLAYALAPVLGAAPGALVLRSDEIRKRRRGVAPEERLSRSAYRASASAAVYAELFALAGEAARAGHAVIADALFLDPLHRAAIEDAARAAGVAFTGLWLHAPLEVLRARIAARRGDASDATVAVLDQVARNARPGPFTETWHRLDAAADPVPAARALLGA